jgi:hypothetical protein
MISSILTIFASIAGLIGAWALWKFILRPHFQAWQNKTDTAQKEKENAEQVERNTAGNADDKKRQASRDDDWDELLKK